MNPTTSGRRQTAAALLAALLACTAAQAQQIEDHSLPKSAVKTYHVKCPGWANGRLAMIRYDTRQDPVRLCASVQDGSKPQQCEVVPRGVVAQAVAVQAETVCK